MRIRDYFLRLLFKNKKYILKSNKGDQKLDKWFSGNMLFSNEVGKRVEQPRLPDKAKK